MSQKLNIVHCRICKGEIDRNIQKENIDWIMRSKNWYYHKKCFDEWVRTKDDIHTNDPNEEFWKDASYYFMTKELLISIDFNKFNSQWKNFLKKKYTPKGIYFSLKYFYEEKKNSTEDARGGIGIVQYIYSDACAYWINKENNDRGICKRIEEQIIKKNTQNIVYKQIKNKKQKTKKGNLSQVLKMEEGI